MDTVQRELIQVIQNIQLLISKNYFRFTRKASDLIDKLYSEIVTVGTPKLPVLKLLKLQKLSKIHNVI